MNLILLFVLHWFWAWVNNVTINYIIIILNILYIKVSTKRKQLQLNVQYYQSFLVAVQLLYFRLFKSPTLMHFLFLLFSPLYLSISYKLWCAVISVLKHASLWTLEPYTKIASICYIHFYLPHANGQSIYSS